MYANDFAAGRGVKPGSLTLALAMTALPIAGLVLSLNVTQLIKDPGTLIGYRVIEESPPPPIVQPKTKVDTKTPISETPYVPPIKPEAKTDNDIKTTIDYPPFVPAEPGQDRERAPSRSSRPSRWSSAQATTSAMPTRCNRPIPRLKSAPATAGGW